MITEEQEQHDNSSRYCNLNHKEVTTGDKLLLGVMVSVIPVIVVFLSLQRYYIEGITMSGIKG